MERLNPGRIGMHILRDGVLDEHNGARAASDRCRLAGADVHYVGADRAVPQGIERTTNQGRRNIPDPGEHQYLHIVEVARNAIWRVSRDEVYVEQQ